MPKVPLTQASYASRSFIAEAQRCINLYAENNPKDAQFPFTYYLTPGLKQVGSYTAYLKDPNPDSSAIIPTVVQGSPGRGPCAALFNWLGVLYAVVAGNLYMVNSSFYFTLLGQVGGGNTVSIAANNTTMMIVNGAYGWIYAPAGLRTAMLVAAPAGATSIQTAGNFPEVGDTLVVTLDNGNQQAVTIASGSAGAYTIDTPLADSAAQFNVVWDQTQTFAEITDAAFLGGARVDQVDGYFVLPKPFSNEWYISLFELAVFDPLDFAAKITYEDNVASLIAMHGEIWLFGATKSTEIWYNTGAADFTFGILPGTIVEHGCVAPASVAKVDLSIFWLGNDLQGQSVVFQGNAYQAKRVSTHAIEHAIQQYPKISDAVGMTYQLEGHFFYVLTFPSGDATWVYDLTTGLWHQWGWTDGNGLLHRHRANAIVTCYGVTLVGDWEFGQLYILDEGTYQDNVGPIVRTKSWQHLVQDNKRVAYTSFVADMEVGEDFTDGVMEVSLVFSDTKGKTWGNKMLQSIGAGGEYLTNIQWRRLGMARDRVFEISWSLDCETALNGAFVEFEVAET